MNSLIFRSLIFLAALAAPLRANDEIFPPAPAAANTINFDGKGFLIHGQREFLASGSIHYARVPRELWRDRLLKLKRAGFNVVQTYVLWNWQEPRKGQIDLTTGARDLGAFLQTAQDVGLYATVRVGPYCCAEWNDGGYPTWLRFEPDLKVRCDNPAFLSAVDAYWDKLLPIVAAHQIHRGGNVILVQLENEDPEGWGTDMPNSYFTHLQKKALDAGIEVPYFFSGLHHGTDPAGNNPWNGAKRTSPLYSTETWLRWFDTYGNSSPDALAEYTRHAWNLVADGFAGFNLYMVHGGSDFDFFNSTDVSASYDYGTLIGQAGDLRNIYYTVRRASTFATSFPDITGNSTNTAQGYDKFATGPDVTTGTKTGPTVHAFARVSPAGTAIFVRNTQKTPETATLQSGQTLQLDPLEVAPLLADATLAPGIHAKLAAVRTLGLATHGATTTWIVYGKPGEKAHIDLDLDQPAAIASGAPALFQATISDPKHPAIDLAFTDDVPQALVLSGGGQTLRILAETVDWTNRTWIIGERGSQVAITGPDYVGDYAEKNGKAQFTAGRNFGNPELKSVTIYGEAPPARQIAVTDSAPNDDASAPALGTWEVAKADAPAAVDCTDTTWFSSENPQQNGADGDPSTYAWYRASFDSPAAGKAHLATEFGDKGVVFLNGKLVGRAWNKNGIGLDLAQGHNTLAIFTSNFGHGSAYNYINKPLLDFSRTGILSPVTVNIGSQKIPVTNWKMRGGVGEPDASNLTWEPAPSANTGAPAFFRTSFQVKPPGELGPQPIYRLTTTGLTRGSVWLNGHNLGRYPEKIKVDGIYLPECWLKDGQNDVAIFDEEGTVPTASVHIWCEKDASRELLPVNE
jgi:beta-galactosidase